MKYRVTDTDAPLLEKSPIVEAASPKKAAEKIHKKVEGSSVGRIVVSRLEPPFRSYTYQKAA